MAIFYRKPKKEFFLGIFLLSIITSYLATYSWFYFFGEKKISQQAVSIVEKKVETIEKSISSLNEKINTFVSGQNTETNLDQTIDDANSSTGGKIIEKITTLIPSNTILKLDDQVQLTTSDLKELLPSAQGGNPIYFDSEEWKTASKIYFNEGQIGINRQPSKALEVGGNAYISGYLWIDGSGNDNLIKLHPSGNTGYLSSNGGALFIDNTYNDGSGIGIFSNAGSSALGNMINIKVDNPEFQQAAFYMDYDGTSNAVEIRSNTNDRTSNALSLTNFNQLDSGLGVIGYEIDRGSIKVTHIGTGSDSSASGLSIDLQGTGTKAQGIYVNSTATGGTSGNLLRLRNESIDRFVVDSGGSLTLGANSTDTSITKLGNNSGDHFFIGKTGAFRVQRSATDSEAFRVQVEGDNYGRWLGTADGKLKWSSGSADYDVILERTGANTLTLTNATLEITSPNPNSDVIRWEASDGSRIGRIVETAGGHGWFEIDDNTGNAKIVFRADGGSSYINSGNFGIGTTNFGTSANKVISIGNGTAPTTSIADGIQLFATDFDDGDGTATSELRVRDEDGNVTTLSPHNFSLIPKNEIQDLDWSYYSQRDNKAINVNMTEVIRLVEELSGKQLLFIKDLQTGEEIRSLTNLEQKTPSTDGDNVTEKVSGPNILSGEVTIPVGKIEIQTTFDTPFIKTPFVTITPQEFISGSYKITKASDSFTIILEKEQDKEIKFDWMAIE